MQIDWTWLLTVASLVGVVLNIRKDRRCFAIWIATNAGWGIKTSNVRSGRCGNWCMRRKEQGSEADS